MFGRCVYDGVIVDISNGASLTDNQDDPNDAIAQVAFGNDGSIAGAEGLTPLDLGDWVIPTAAAPGSYEIFVDNHGPDSLDGASDSVDTWLALSSTRQWFITQDGVGAKSVELEISIRLNGGATLSTGTFTLAVNVI